MTAVSMGTAKESTTATDTLQSVLENLSYYSKTTMWSAPAKQEYTETLPMYGFVQMQNKLVEIEFGEA